MPRKRRSILPPNPRRSAAGKANRAKRGPLTPAGRERLRQAALKNKPWLRSTGPRTAEGKAKAAVNGKKNRKKGEPSVRELRASLADTRAMMAQFAELRRQLEG